MYYFTEIFRQQICMNFSFPMPNSSHPTWRNHFLNKTRELWGVVVIIRVSDLRDTEPKFCSGCRLSKLRFWLRFFVSLIIRSRLIVHHFEFINHNNPKTGWYIGLKRTLEMTTLNILTTNIQLNQSLENLRVHYLRILNCCLHGNHQMKMQRFSYQSTSLQCVDISINLFHFKTIWFLDTCHFTTEFMVINFPCRWKILKPTAT
jgi:hypothetical protein